MIDCSIRNKILVKRGLEEIPVQFRFSAKGGGVRESPRKRLIGAEKLAINAVCWKLAASV